MSDRSESGSERGGRKSYDANDICRDFLRSMCRRGNRCKYRHPAEREATEYKKISEYTFCHDYRFNGCRRSNCKFLHCTQEEEDHARMTGELPTHVLQAVSLGIGVDNAELVAKGGIPVCKDNLKGGCRRGSGCKYRHISSSEYEYLQRKSENRDEFDRYNDYEHEPKRRRMDPEYNSYGSRSQYSSTSPTSRPLSFQLMEDENTMLRRKVEELKKQVSDLTATNEVLLEQNARYRANQLQSMNSIQAQQTIQQTALNPLITRLAQQIALASNSELNKLSQQHALQQCMARELAAGPGQSTIGAPQTLNTPTLSMNPPSILSVSLPQTLTGLQSSVHQSPSQNMDMNPALVSYPMVSQGMRMTASSLAQ